MKKVANVIHFVSKWLGYLCAILLFCLAMVTFVDCLLRYIGSRSIPGAQELTEVGMGFFTYLGLPAVIQSRSGIQVPLIMDKLSNRGKSIMRFVLDLLSLGILIVVATQVIKTAQTTEFTTAILKIPYAPVYYFATFSSAWGCIEFLIHVVEDIQGIISPAKNEEVKA